MFSKTWWASGKCVESYHVLTGILEVIPPAPVRVSLESYVREDTLFLCVKFSRNSNFQADSVYAVWDSCCITVLHTHTHGNELFSLN